MLIAGKRHLSCSQSTLISKFHSCCGANRYRRAKPAIHGEEYKLEMAFSSCLPCGCSILEGLNPEDTDLISAELPAVISCYQPWSCSELLLPRVPSCVSVLPGSRATAISIFGTIWKDQGGIP